MWQSLKNKFFTFSGIIFFILFFEVKAFAQDPPPTITSFTPSPVCQGDSVTITGTNFINVQNVFLGTDVAGFVVKNKTTITAAVSYNAATGKVKVVAATGTATSDKDITINASPQPDLQDVSPGAFTPFTNCDGNKSYTLHVKNISIPAGGSCFYDIDWGDNSFHFTQTDWPVGDETVHPYSSQGYFAIKITITAADGCKKQKTINFYNGANPLATFSTLFPTTSMCADTVVTFTIGDWFKNTPGTYYRLLFDDGTDTTLQSPLNLADTVQWVKHTYKTSSCPKQDFTAVLDVVNGCYTKEYTQNQIVVRIKPKPDFTFTDSVCINDQVCFDDKTINGYSGAFCDATTNYVWNFGDGNGNSTESSPCHIYTKAGNYKVTLTASNTSCGSSDITKTITIKPTSVVPIVTSPVIYCQFENAVPLKATGTNLLWYTTATGGIGSTTAPTPSTNIPGTITYYVSQTLANECESPRVPVTVTVNALPSPPGVISPVQLCKGQTAQPLTATGSNLLWYTTATGGTGSATAPTPSTQNIGTTKYYVSQTINNCESKRDSIEVIVSEIPPSPTVGSPVQYCQNQNADQLTATGTNLLWYTTATGGTGTSIAPVPSTSTPGKTVYYVSQSNYCGESERASIEVDIFAGPSATISYAKNVLCNVVDVSGSNPPVAVTLTGTTGGIFSITPSGLPIDASTGTIIPSGATAGTYTISYFIQSTGGCSDFTTKTTVTVTNTPKATISYPLMCTSEKNVNVIFSGTSGGTFSSTAGLKLDATTGNIDPSASTPGKYTVTYTITASAPCPGFTTTTDITITKAPLANISYGVTNLCNVVNTDSTPNPQIQVNLTGTTGGTFTISPEGLWIDNASGTIDPSNAKAGTYTVTYTIAASGGCSVYTNNAQITVNGTPSASIKYPPICSSDLPVKASLTGTQGGSFSSTTGLDINSLTGGITPANSKPGTYKVTYTIAASPPCPGFITSTDVTITQAPSAAINYGANNFCNVKNTQSTPNPEVNVIRTGNSGGTYSINPLAGLTINASTGTITPSEATAGTYVITYTVKGSGGCSDFTTQSTIVINGAPTAAIKYNGSPFCSGSNILQQVSLTGTQGGTFSSSADLSIDANTGAINPSLSKPGIYTVTYTIVPSPPCPGFTTTASVTINESPSISFDISKQAVCSGNTAIFKPSSTVANTVYDWSVKGSLPQNISGITSGSTSGANASINLLFTNSGTASETITIVVSPVNPTSNPCSGVPYELTLTVNPIPAKLKGDTTEFCMHAPPMALTANADAGNTVKWYDANNVLLSQAPVINTINPAQFDFYATQANVYGCESPSSKFMAIVHPVAKIISSSYTNPTSCGIPSGSITLNVVDLNGNAMPLLPVHVHYTKFQTNYSVAATTDASGKITIALTAGTYTDLYVETFSCLSEKIPDVFVLKDPNPPAQPVAGYNAPLCSESVFNLSASSATSNQNGVIDYVWVGPAFGSTPDTSQNTTVSFPSAQTSYNGIYIVYAIQNNCISLPTSFAVEIKQSPSKPKITTRTPLCIGDNLSLAATSSIIGNNTLNYVWNGPGTGFPVNSANASISPVKIEDGGVYSSTVTSPETGCSATADTLIQVGGYPVVQFSKDSFNLPTGYIMHVTPTILNASDKNILPIAKYTWTPPENVQCNDGPCTLPTITVKKNMCYNVTATNIYGCSGSDTICITTFCNNAQVFIPNAFTPKGLAANSKFMIRASGIASVKSFRVFNRWGRIVFEKNNFPPNDPAYAWDGYINGKLADMGVYVYTVDVVCENGTPYTYKGNVTLIQ